MVPQLLSAYSSPLIVLLRMVINVEVVTAFEFLERRVYTIQVLQRWRYQRLALFQCSRFGSCDQL
uniref:Uncharacterized protein n=1 Tax=Physcomitrium patens TaxID=3218 RepID=A0A2K1IQP3_PHYPA|nr:hypothetical protein PHYPA_025717 [Physcomitrium patens]